MEIDGITQKRVSLLQMAGLIFEWYMEIMLGKRDQPTKIDGKGKRRGDAVRKDKLRTLL